MDNNPISLNDPDGDCPLCYLIALLFVSDYAWAPTGRESKVEMNQASKDVAKEKILALAPVPGSKFIKNPTIVGAVTKPVIKKTEQTVVKTIVKKSATVVTKEAAKEFREDLNKIFQKQSTAEYRSILRNIIKKSTIGKNTGLEGNHSYESVRKAGKEFVGDGAKEIYSPESNKFIGWESADGKKLFRPPSYKVEGQASGEIQANFQQRTSTDYKWTGQSSDVKAHISNTHVNTDKKFEKI